MELTEAWKTQNIVNYPFKLETNNQGRNDGGRSVRPSTNKMWNDNSKTKAASMSMSRDCAKLWNSAHINIINAPNLLGAKRLLKVYCKILVA